MAAAILLASIRVFNHNRFVADLITTGVNSRTAFNDTLGSESSIIFITVFQASLFFAFLTY